MKRIIRMAIVFCIICLVSVCAAYADDAAEDYDTIQTLMKEAVENPDDAETQFGLITRYYEKNTALNHYFNADYYYKYAKGRLLFAEGDYDSAYNCFYGMPDSFFDGVEVAYYIRFCEAVWDKQDAAELNRVEDYETAIASFKEAQALTAWPAACVEQIADCETRCGELIKQEAAKCCTAGNHEEAQAYYDRLIAFENKSFSREGKRLKEACVKHSAFFISTPEIEYLGDNIARVSWTTTCDSILITVNQGKSSFSNCVTESYYDIANAAPGSNISVMLDGGDAGIPAMEAQLTVPATVSVKAHYEDGKRYMDAGLYTEAAECFNKAGNHKDSTLLGEYCRGMICLAEADEDEKTQYLDLADEHVNEAKKHFNLLAGAGYEGADKLVAYCSARSCEYRMMYTNAVDGYAELGGILDSSDRYMRLENKEYLPKKEVVAGPPAIRTGVAGTVSRANDVYAGPSTKTYVREKALRLHAEQEVNVVGIENNYYLIEVEQNGELYRVWCIKERISSQPDLIEKCGEKSRKTRIIADTPVLYGPGDKYAARNFVIPRNTKVTAYEQEDQYTMIEYDDNGTTYRGWVLTDKISK